MEENKIKKMKTWYNENEYILDRMATKIKNLIEEILEYENIPYVNVMSIKKDLESLCNKANNPKYDDPINQIKDFISVRIVAYVESDVKKISDIIKDSFYIDENYNIDKSEDLSSDKFGYRSVNYAAKLNEKRNDLQEYRRFENFYFEVQIRTLLHHTWSEIENDRNYKFSGSLPDEIKRKFSLIAGTLELMDNQFDTIAKELDNYKEDINDKAKKGEIKDIAINGTSLKAYLVNKFSDKIGNLISPEFGKLDSGEEEIINELHEFGISDLEKLDNLINNHINKDIFTDNENLLSILRAFMIVENPEKYFKDSWKNYWQGYSKKGVNKLEKYNPDSVDIMLSNQIDML